MKWISVNDRLPDVVTDNCSDDVLIAIIDAEYYNDGYTICCGYLLDGKWWAYMDHNCNEIGSNLWNGDKVEYWMPLPKAPVIQEVFSTSK